MKDRRARQGLNNLSGLLKNAFLEAALYHDNGTKTAIANSAAKLVRKIA